MNEMNPFTPKDNDQGHGESNVFLDLNKPDEATGVPSVAAGFGSESAQGGGFAARAAENSKFNGQVLLAGIVFTIGVGSIYAMRYIGMQAGIKESVTMVEYTASTTTPDFVKRFDTVMENLNEVSVSVRFEDQSQLPQTPFTLASIEDPAETEYQPTTTPIDPSVQQERLARERAQRAKAQREARIQEYEYVAGNLQLQSVIGGTRPVARISGEPVGIGMTVADLFKVTSIKGSPVTLEVDGIKLELSLGSPAVRVD